MCRATDVPKPESEFGVALSLSKFHIDDYERINSRVGSTSKLPFLIHNFALAS